MTTTFEIENLKHKITDYSSSQCDYYSEACIVTLERQNHRSGVSMLVDGTMQGSYCLEWQASPNTNGWQAKRKLVENAATAIAFFLVAETTEYSTIIESEILQGEGTTGIDYWLSYGKEHDSYDEDNFMRARLEISGINTGDAKHIQSRLDKKIEQVKASDETGTPVYIVIVEFGTPVAILFEKL